MSHLDKVAALENIRRNIEKYGHHIYFVSGGATPSYAYTIGLNRSVGFELILAGASFYSYEEGLLIINELAARLVANMNLEGLIFIIDPHGAFSLRSVDDSWSRELILGAFDFYSDKSIRAVQIVADKVHSTIDVPDLSTPWTIESQPVWKWLYVPWDRSIPDNSVAVTNLPALQGARITEATRWEDDEWELFAGGGPDVPENEFRTVPLATLLAVDQSLDVVTDLKIGEGVWRDEEHEWQSWERSGS